MCGRLHRLHDEGRDALPSADEATVEIESIDLRGRQREVTLIDVVLTEVTVDEETFTSHQ